MATDPSGSPLRRYQELIVGSHSLAFTIKYELITVICQLLPGATGIYARNILYRKLVGRAGSSVLFDCGVVLRHPQKIQLGDNLVIANGSIIDARGSTNDGVRIANGVVLGQRTMLLCKNGNINIGSNVGIGAYTALYAVGGNTVKIGDNVMLGPFCCLEASIYHHDRLDIPIAQQGLNSLGGVTIGEGAWLGAHVTVLDGVTVGSGAIVAANSLVTRDVPKNAIVGGAPARIVRYRDDLSPVDAA